MNDKHKKNETVLSASLLSSLRNSGYMTTTTTTTGYMTTSTTTKQMQTFAILHELFLLSKGTTAVK